MIDAFNRLGDEDLKAIIQGLRLGKIAPPYSSLQLTQYVPQCSVADILAGLIRLDELQFSPQQIVEAMELLDRDREYKQSLRTQIDLVTSGPEPPGVNNRDTAVVVREMFSQATESVLVVGYSVHQGQQVFKSLAERMEVIPGLSVRLILNIDRPDRDESSSEILVARYKQRFIDTQWPAGHRLPEVFYDPRSVSDDQPIRSSLHAKCVVVDRRLVFVSSANFTEAGQKRNIEVGLSIQNEWIADRLSRHFELLAENRLVVRAI